MTTYKTFTRSARNFEEFATAKKKTVNRGLSSEQARGQCHQHNENRTAQQIAKGTKMEFTAE